MNSAGIFRYYEREDVRRQLLKISEGREVAGVYKDGGFSKRPNTLIYPKDISMLVRGGAVAFHGSLEKWENPMAVGTDGYEKGRKGWDLILDLDCNMTEHGKAAAAVLIKALKKHGVSNVSLKFTGGTGFHLGIASGSLPDSVDYRPVKEQYPGLARITAQYLREFVRSDLEKKLLSKWSPEKLSEQAGVELGDLFTEEGDDGIDPFRVVDVDPILISPRHLFRLPYSLHETKHLVSLPLDPADLEEFRKEDAAPERVKAERGFLDSYEKDEADMLVTEAVDWHARQQKKEQKAARVIEQRPDSAVPIELAPPCIRNISKGLADGRKRSVFVLINYLSSLGWGWEEISQYLVEWNQKNRPPLGETYIRGQLRWHSNRGKRIPPANCSNRGYYEDIGVCSPDGICGGEKKTIKNPVNYALRKLRKK